MVNQEGYGNGAFAAIFDNLTFNSTEHTITTVKNPFRTLTVSLESWTSKYGVSFEFLVCLHLGTLSPEFVLDLCGSKDDRTKVIIGIKNVATTYKFSWQDDGEVVIPDLYTAFEENESDENGSITIEGYTFTKEFIDRINKYKDNKELYYPFILRTENHWYRDVIFRDYNNTDINCYDDKGKLEVDVAFDDETINKEIEEMNNPGSLSVKLISLDGNGEAYGCVEQIKKPYYIDKIPKIIELINENKYHIFKGSYSDNIDDADISSASEEDKKKFVESLPYYTEPKKIKWLTSINAGIQLLQQVETEQAEYNLRDLKEILAYYKFSIDESEEEGEYSTATNQEEIEAQKAYEEWCNNWRNRVSGYVDTNGNVVNAIEGDEDPEGQGYVNWGKYIIPDDEDEGTRTANTSKLEDSSLNIAARGIGNTGFGYGESVCSTLNGKVVAVTENSITIKSDDDTLMHISNISTNSDIEVGNTVYVGTEVATTTDKNINVILKDKYHNTLDVEKYIDVAVLINAYA